MKIHLSYLAVIGILLGILFFQQQCKRPCPDPEVTHDTITKPGDPFPVLVEVGQPDPIYYEEPYIMPALIDTMGVILDYFTKYYYADTIKDDSSAFIALFETVKGNRIIDRSFSFQNRRATQVITPMQKQRNAVYAGFQTSLNPDESLDFGPAVMLITKKGYGYSYAYGVNEKSHTVSFVWKISFRNKHPPD